MTRHYKNINIRQAAPVSIHRSGLMELMELASGLYKKCVNRDILPIYPSAES